MAATPRRGASSVRRVKAASTGVGAPASPTTPTTRRGRPAADNNTPAASPTPARKPLPSASPSLPPPRWLSANPDKRWGETFFLYYSAAWIACFGCVVVSGVWEHFDAAAYMAVCVTIAAPAVLAPLVLQPAAVAARPFFSRYWVKANIWVAIFSLVGHHVWTHYFFQLLGEVGRGEARGGGRSSSSCTSGPAHAREAVHIISAPSSHHMCSCALLTLFADGPSSQVPPTPSHPGG